MMRRVILSVAAILSAAAFSSAAGQAGTTGSLVGTVASESGAPLSGVLVTALSPSQVVKATTDARGTYAFASLTPDVYMLVAERSGLQSVAIPGITVFADIQQRVPVTMPRAIVTIIRDFPPRPFLGTGWQDPRIVADLNVYRSYYVAKLDSLPWSNGMMFRLTPGITFGAGAPMTH